MVERSDRLSFPSETLDGARAVRFVLLRDEEFERDNAVEAAVAGAVNNTHTALAALLQDLVLRVLGELVLHVAANGQLAGFRFLYVIENVAWDAGILNAVADPEITLSIEAMPVR